MTGIDRGPTRRIVGIADLRVSADPSEELITYALGSCLGVAVHDPRAGVGGLLHAMLPSSTADPERRAVKAAQFVDTGVPELFRACYAIGAQKERMVVKVAGCAALFAAGDDLFQIGHRNFVMLRKLLWKNGILLRAHDVGGSASRTLSLAIGTGSVAVRTGTVVREL